MRKFLVILFLTNFFSFAADCEMLSAKYDAPDPTTRTMAQISRWIERKVTDNPSDAKALEACLIAEAADNPNKEQVAGK